VTSSLSDLRSQLARLDESLLRIVAERQAIAGEIGRIKAAMGRSTRDYAQEKEVLNRVRRAATDLGLDPNLAEQLSLLLIRASLTVQEQDRVHSSAGGEGRKVLIIGGAGKMGRWFARFLNSQGFAVEIADPAGNAEDFPHVADWRTSSLDHDFIVVAHHSANPLRFSRRWPSARRVAWCSTLARSRLRFGADSTLSFVPACA
jgi:chorismate mutase / prephenate dehydrogenase